MVEGLEVLHIGLWAQEETGCKIWGIGFGICGLSRLGVSGIGLEILDLGLRWLQDFFQINMI